MNNLTAKNDTSTTLLDLKKAFVQFREARGWGKHHTPKNLAMSISIEAAELMEHFQWSETTDDLSEVKSKLADIISYCLSFADTLGIDITDAFFTKLEEIDRRYPAEAFSKDSGDMNTYKAIRQRRKADKAAQ